MSTRPPKLPTWASGAGDNVQPTNGEITAGWPTSQTPPSRQRFNWFFNLVMNGVQYLIRRGISDWTSDEDYSIGDKSMGSDLKTYIAIQASTNKDPVTEPTYWAPWALTQGDADTRYALKNGDDGEVFQVADATNPKDAVNLDVLSKVWPIGSVYENTISNLNPADPSLLGFGTWVATQAGRFSVGYQSGDALFGTVGNEGGARGHKMTAGNLIAHTHTGGPGASNGFSAWTNPGTNTVPDGGDTGSTGYADPDAIPTLPPYHVSYKWVRTA